tara:strand:+ start:3718 stop:4326 length:609 start_codon:yes stop_codon:yes gene_type:complete
MARSSVDTKGFQQMMRDLSFIKGKDLAEVVKEEATAVLNKATKSTKAAKVAKIKNEEQRLHAWFQSEAKAGKPVRASVQKRKLAAVKKRQQEKLLMRGMAKGTYYLIGRQLGLQVEAPSYAVKAVEKARSKLSNAVKGTVSGTDKYEVTIKNFSIVAMTYDAGGYRAFTRAMRGRMSYFQRRLQDGFRKRIKKAVKTKAKVT